MATIEDLDKNIEKMRAMTDSLAAESKKELDFAQWALQQYADIGSLLATAGEKVKEVKKRVVKQ